ncbi:receptor-like protein EIX2 isoform X1 [Prosopis cineraria]|uniref:receptor-like protein EIX2 isoform X1 n=1 Tax=Prosopis cineraria TaxID=364024 RepID=UPI002410A550|nr:receptor-like protein EIX2 isoform X1 [Prosopis cineraria]
MDSLLPSFLAVNVFILWSLLFVIILPKGMCSLRVRCNEKDRHALLNFKHTVVDPSAKLSGWSDERDCCEWIGVHCDNTTGRVIELNLSCSPKSVDDICQYKSQCLTGELPLSLLRLEFLNYLDLSSNDFKVLAQDADVNITNCSHRHLSCENSSNLHHLDLSYNKDLHIDNLHWLSRVPSLKYVNLNAINLQDKVDWIQLSTLLPSLTSLSLGYCQLRNINPSLKHVNLTSLEVLSIPGNAFTYLESIPNWLFNFSDITTIDLNFNHFQGQFPKGLLNLQKIKKVYLAGNKLNGPIPYWLGQLEHLQCLDVGINLFSGPIPFTLGNLSSLISLKVEFNHLNDTLPESFGQLLNLKELDISNNQFRGEVSERNFLKLSNLKHLHMGSPGLIFAFDSMWVPPFQLTYIHLEHSKIPTWLYTQTSLQSLIIADSIFQASLEFQDNFWDFAAQVQDFVLLNSMIDGDMSNVLLNSTFISFYSNTFKTSSLPRLSPNVVQFHAENNFFSGSISSLLCHKINERSQLQYLRMSNNSLYGGLTNCWMNWKSLVFIQLDNNNLTGTIPSSIGVLSNLTFLVLNKNNLFGQMPSSLKNCQNLEILDVRENKLSGSIPNWLWHKVKILQLRSNHFRGNIPPEICKLASLIVLDLANNNISGSLPSCLYNMTAMTSPHSSHYGVPSWCITASSMAVEFEGTVLLLIKGAERTYSQYLVCSIDISSNNMSGTLPSEIVSLAELRSLNLSHNQFEGNIPKEIGNLKQLESLDLASNRLSGEIPQSMVGLSFLGAMNLSFNNFSGKIPSGTQLQSFDALSYIGNPELCGAPLPKNCSNEKGMKPIKGYDNDQEDEFLSSFYIASGVGFSMAFWGVCIAIFCIRSFRNSYFRFLFRIRDKLYIMVALTVNRFS